jgi:energy-coupling factor transporter transmembrane protein EcfT
VHPAVRVLLLLVLASALPAMALPALAAIGLSGFAMHARYATDALARLRSGLWRLRWLLLAIFVLYGGFTPGEPLLPAMPGLSREGLAEGLRRALVLIDLLVMVYLLLALTPTPQLVLAVRVLTQPLRLVGVDPDRVGLRIALALDRVSSLQQRLRLPAEPGASIWQRSARVIGEIEQQGDPAIADAVDLPAAAPPRWVEWFLPPLLFVALHAAVRGGLV